MAIGVSTMTAAQQGIPWETDPEKIPDDAYVSVSPDGHLQVDGRRVRFWGHIGHFPNPRLNDHTPEQCRRDHELMVQRMVDLGFNMHRLWHGPDGEFEKGDGSRNDLAAYGVYLLKKNGVRVWFGQLNNMGVIDPETDVTVIDDPNTAEAWKDSIIAMAHKSWKWKGEQTPVRSNLAQHWDPRLQALALKRMRKIATFRNPYTGMRRCDDPNFAVWELSNEEWWMPKMMRGEWLKLPNFFQAQLIAKWQDWLTEKYGTDEKLRNAWGFLLDGENLENRTVLLAPTAASVTPAKLNDPNPHARAAMEGGADTTIERDDFPRARPQDVIRFFLDVLLESKSAQAKMVKALGKSTRFAPLCWDTGIGWSIQSQYLHQHAEAVTHCTYINGKHHDPTDEEFPFNSQLTEPPGLCWDLPWVEHNRTPGKPYFVYETQIKTSTRYRAEYPMAIASLAAIQDWDIINWHTYGPGPDSTKPNPNTRALEVGHSMDLHFGGDEVQLAAMRAASEIFRNGLVAPAPEPTMFVFGRRALLDPASMDYSGSYGEIGQCFVPTAYRYGMRLVIDPTLDDRPDDPLFAGPDGTPDCAKHERFRRQGYMVLGTYCKPDTFYPNPLQPNDQITYDRRRGFLTFDAPGVAMFTGFYGYLEQPEEGIEFPAAGTEFSAVTVKNPAGMPYPVTEDERYITVALASCDGQPLADCERAVLSAVSTSFNTGFSLNLDEALREFHGADAKNPGTLPVLVARVGATIACDAVDGMNYVMRDYEMNVIGKGSVSGGRIVIPADKPVFFVELTR